jgi:hypothetical protein
MDGGGGSSSSSRGRGGVPVLGGRALAVLAVLALAVRRACCGLQLLRASGVGFISRDGLVGSRSTWSTWAGRTAGVLSHSSGQERCGRVI